MVRRQDRPAARLSRRDLEDVLSPHRVGVCTSLFLKYQKGSLG